MIALDTNLLVYSHREDSQFHVPAWERICQLASQRSAWAIPWPCVHEFLAIVTHPRIYKPATPLSVALETVRSWLEAPNLVLLCEGPDYFEVLSQLLESGQISGPKVHDARIAALCLSHGVRELWSADRDFSRFPALKVRNPL